MKSNLKFDNKNFIAEVSISNIMEEDEAEMHNEYMSECMLKDESLINTAGMRTSDAKYMCGMSYMKSRSMLTEMAGQLTEKQKTLPPALQKAILKNMQKKLERKLSLNINKLRSEVEDREKKKIKIARGYYYLGLLYKCLLLYETLYSV